MAQLRGEHERARARTAEAERTAGEAQREACEALEQHNALASRDLLDLRCRLEAAEAVESELKKEIHGSTAHFTEKTRLVYAEVERLHASISKFSLRRDDSNGRDAL